MEPAELGCGACARSRCSLMVFSLSFGCVVDTGRAAQVLPTLAEPGNSCRGTAGSCVVGSPEGGRVSLDRVDDVDWSGGANSCSRKGAHVVWQRESMAQLELDESLRWCRRSERLSEDVRISMDVVSNEQLGSVQLCFLPDHRVHGQRPGSHCKGFTRLECEGMAEDLPDGFPEERCKVGGDGTGRLRWTRIMWWQMLEMRRMPT